MTIGRREVLRLSLASAALAGPVAKPTVADSQAVAESALGIGLESWPYPGPVAFLPLTMAGQSVRMAYMDFAAAGAVNGRTVFLLHGKNFDSSYWARPIQWLRQAGFRVVVPDQIGFNKSSKPDIDYSFAALARNTITLADTLSLQRIIVFGHSTGGALGVRLASIYPQRVELLVLEDPIGLVDYRRYIPPQETETLVAAEYAYTTDTYRAFISHFFQTLPAAAQETFVTWRMRVTESSEFDRFARAAALTYQMIYRQPLRALYAELSMPVLITAGSKDRSIPLIAYAPPDARAAIPSIHEAAQAAAKEVRKCHFASFDGAGHIPHLEMPEEFCAVLLEFINSQS